MALEKRREAGPESGPSRRPEPIRIPAQFQPKIAAGLDLIGEYKDSGFKRPPYIVRRADGQTVQLSHLLFAIAEASDGRHDYQALAERASDATSREVSADNVQFLVLKKLIPLGVIALPDGRAVGARRADPMLALKFRAAIVPEGLVNALTTIFKPLYWPPVVIAVLLGFIAVDAYVFWLHGVAQGIRQLLYEPVLLLMVLALIVASTAFHELGHATACAYGGARPGVLGAGIYIVWPAFYSDVTDAYRLSKAGRLRTDLGGVYFNAAFMLLVFGAYLLTRFEPLLVMLALQNLEMIHQFLPFLRLDGYYVVADVTGVPDLFGRVKPILKSVVPGEGPDEKVTELKGWVRIAVTAWVALMVPLVLYIYAMLIVGAPRAFATAWDSLSKQWTLAHDASGRGEWALIALAVVQALLLVLPAVGLVVMFAQTGRRVWTVTEGRPVLRGVASVVAVVIVAAMVAFWPPRHHNYTPIQPADTGTIPAASTTLVASRTTLTDPIQLQQPAQDMQQVQPSAAPDTSPSPQAQASPSPSPSPNPSSSPSPSPALSPSPSASP